MHRGRILTKLIIGLVAVLLVVLLLHHPVTAAHSVTGATTGVSHASDALGSFLNALFG